jgi:hypothetical protein
VLAALAACGLAAQAADWSDTSIGARYGTKLAEPFNPSDIKKGTVNLDHVSGYKYGINFFNADFLMCNSKDPAGAGSTNGAQEVYIGYRHILDLEKVTGTPQKFSGLRGVGLTAGFDVNAKTDAGYNSKKRMIVAGPTLCVDVPGFLNVSLLALWESNAPYNTYSKVSTPRYDYGVHPILTAAWSIPFNVGIPLAFEGFAHFIACMGKYEFGDETAAETNIDMQVMYDMSPLFGAGKYTF